MATPSIPTQAELEALSRRGFLRYAFALFAGAPPVAALISACGAMGEEMSTGMMEERMPGWMMSRGMDAELMRDMRVIHELLVHHEQIDRQVDDIRGGIEALTKSDDDALAGRIQTHVRQMQARLARGDPIREMDPLFREIFEHHEAIKMQIENVRGGVRVTETSDDPQVTLLIRQHARRAVSEFVAGGMTRAMRPTPLPPGYRG